MSLTAQLDEKDDGQVFVSWTLNSFLHTYLHAGEAFFGFFLSGKKKFVRSLAGFFPGLSWGWIDFFVQFFCFVA